MLIFKKVVDLKKFLDSQRSQGQTIGFIPTMGALHAGHISLIKKAQESVDITVVSIFVNPTQFNDQNDLKKYPKPFAEDVNKLVTQGTSILFHPEAQEVYPPGLDTQVNIDFGHLIEVMEGEFRPGHFDGMANVVSRLLDIVGPEALFMGLKDFQQLSIVRYMIQSQQRNIRLVGCPIIREADGLAMSSRNRRLEPAIRAIAPKIHQCLVWATDQLDKTPPRQLEAELMEKLSIPPLRPEYCRLVDGESLQSVADPANHNSIIVCAAVWAGEVRLIDNWILKGKAIIEGSTLKKVIKT